jgi:DNA-binding SARP family transcriptional activator
MDVLGTVRVSGADPTAGTVVPRHDRALALLTYLALAEPVGFHRRDKLIGIFWPELDTDRARHALRQTLHFLRRSLGPVIDRRGDREIGIDWERFECDASGFRAACRNGDGRRAVGLYRGELLDGFGIANAPEFERWLEEVRGQLRRQAVEVGLGLARGCAAGDPGEARRLADWVARLAPYDEAAARAAMAVLDACGDRAAALEIYRRLELQLQRELDVEPSEATRSLADALRGRRASPVAREEPEPAPAPPRAEPVRPAAPRRWVWVSFGAVAMAAVVLVLAFVSRGGGAASVVSPARVLWVDDNPEGNTAVVSLLRAAGTPWCSPAPPARPCGGSKRTPSTR